MNLKKIQDYYLCAYDKNDIFLYQFENIDDLIKILYNVTKQNNFKRYYTLRQSINGSLLGLKRKDGYYISSKGRWYGYHKITNEPYVNYENV